MKVYKCLLSGDEFISDSYKMMEVKDAEGNLVSGEDDKARSAQKQPMSDGSESVVYRFTLC